MSSLRGKGEKSKCTLPMRRKERRHHVTRSAVERGNPDAVTTDDKQQERKDDEAYHINTVLYRYIGYWIV